jgi:dihydrofolate reductase
MKKPRVAFVVAVAKNGVIGRNGALPWRISSDLKRFRAITMGKPVIMGRKTWESLPRKPLEGRTNIVVTRNRDFAAPGALVATSLKDALAKAQGEEVCIIGGGELFREAIPIADRLYLTEIDLDVEGDTFFPTIDPEEWSEVSREVHPRGAKDDADFILRVLDRAK